MSNLLDCSFHSLIQFDFLFLGVSHLLQCRCFLFLQSYDAVAEGFHLFLYFIPCLVCLQQLHSIFPNLHNVLIDFFQHFCIICQSSVDVIMVYNAYLINRILLCSCNIKRDKVANSDPGKVTWVSNISLDRFVMTYHWNDESYLSASSTASAVLWKCILALCVNFCNSSFSRIIVWSCFCNWYCWFFSDSSF